VKSSRGLKILMVLAKIVSGGQTGVDRAALDVALAVDFPCGGWCPADRSAEDGLIPERYPVVPLPGIGFRRRTRQNVIDSDGTIIFYFEVLKGGTRLTRNLCALEKKPFIVLDARQFPESAAAESAIRFVEQNAIAVLNVAGPRRSGWAEGYGYAEAVLEALLRRSREVK
jgi:hypothetical protein